MASRNGRSTASTFVPTGEAFGRAGMEFSLGFWGAVVLAVPEPVPEELIARGPAVIVNHMLDWWSEAPDAFPAEVRPGNGWPARRAKDASGAGALRPRPPISALAYR
jgi:hypothetical protein